MTTPRLDMVTDTEGLVLQVHLVCGATIWWDERPKPEGDGPITEHVCDVCYPEAPEVDGKWARVWAMQPEK